MTLTIHLTVDQDERLRREAVNRGVNPDMLAQQLLVQALNDIGGEIAPLPRKRVLGLHAGQVGIADDFDAPLPDSFWLD
jgi:hypothetical protein